LLDLAANFALAYIFDLQDQRRLGAIIFPNKEEVLKAAKTLSILDADADELGSETLTNLLCQELTTW